MNHARDMAATDLPGLTALRAPLAWWVLMYHISQPGAWFDADHLCEPLRDILRSGYLAVDVFFVLSGYILARVYTDWKPARWRTYAVARIARLWPMHLFALVIALPFAIASQVYDLTTWPILGIVCVSGMQAWIPAWSLAINGPAWSISVEIFFAAVFPWVQPLLGRLQQPSTCLWLMTLCWALATVPVWWLTTTSPELSVWSASTGWQAGGQSIDALKYLPILRLPEFIAGMLLCAWHRQRGWDIDGRIYVSLGIMGLLGIPAFAGHLLPYLPMHNGLLIPATAALIIGLTDQRWNKGILANRWVQIMGRSSFALYLLHIPLLMIFHSLLKRLPNMNILPDVCTGMAAIILIQGIAILALFFIEESARQWIRSRFSPRPVDGIR